MSKTLKSTMLTIFAFPLFLFLGVPVAQAQKEVFSCPDGGCSVFKAGDFCKSGEEYRYIEGCVIKKKKYVLKHRRATPQELIQAGIYKENVTIVDVGKTTPGQGDNDNENGGSGNESSCRCHYSWCHYLCRKSSTGVSGDYCEHLEAIGDMKEDRLKDLKGAQKPVDRNSDYLSECRDACATLALDVNSSCYYSRNKNINEPSEFCLYLTDTEKAQLNSGCNNVTGTKSNSDLCNAILNHSKCAKELSALTTDNFDCGNNQATYAVIDYAKEKVRIEADYLFIRDLEARTKCPFDKDNLEKDIKTYTEDKFSVSCVQQLAEECFNQTGGNGSGDCVDCGNGGGYDEYEEIIRRREITEILRQQGYCTYGPCPYGVSKAAQIIGAIGSIGVPIGLGVMNLVMNQRGLDACLQAYNMQVQQATAVGLPPQNPMCGMGGFGMGGFGGGWGGGFPGIGGGINIGGGIGFPGIGIGGGIGVGGGGGIYGYPGGGGGWGGGFPGGGMYGYPNVNMYGIPTIGGGGGMNIQQQLYDNQLRMQELAMMNMVNQTGAGMGYNNNMYMPGYGTAPYYGMGNMGYGYPGMYSGVNAGAGVSFNAGAGFNIGAGAGAGGGWNPYGGYGGYGGNCGYGVSYLGGC